jgi:hypothetical protein
MLSLPKGHFPGSFLELLTKLCPGQRFPILLDIVMMMMIMIIIVMISTLSVAFDLRKK